MAQASGPGPVREVVEDLVHQVRQRRAQVLEALTYVVLLGGGLYLFSAIGEDSRNWYDTVARTTLGAIGVGVLLLGVLLGGLTLAVDRSVRRRTQPGALPCHLRSRRRLTAAMGAGALLAAAGLVALLGG